MTTIVLCNGETHRFMKPFTPDIEMIAKALSGINRFTGHVGAYSVAQHCVMASLLAPKGYELATLLHDAHEAYIGDMASPLKQLVPDYEDIEEWYQGVIGYHYDVDVRHSEVVKVDTRMLITEAAHFGMHEGHEHLWPDFKPFKTRLRYMQPHTACQLFMERFKELYDENNTINR